jgi:hypothetical protein
MAKEKLPWEEYQQDAAQQGGPWEEYQEPGLQETTIPGLGTTGGLSLLGEIGKIYESALPAPTRSAVGKLKAGGTVKEAGKAFAEQFLQPPEQAPTGEELLGYQGPGKKAAGIATELALDPANLGVIKSLAQQAPKIVPLSKAAMELSNELAVKGMGAMKGQFKELGKKNLIQELGKYAKDMGFVKAGDTVENVLQKSDAALEKTEASLSDIYKKIKDKTLGNDVVAKILSDLHINFGENFGRGAQIADNPMFEKQAQEIIQKELEPILGTDLNAKQLHNVRRDLDKKIKWSKTAQEMPEKQQALLNARNSINDMLNQMANKVAPTDQLKKLNKEYSMTSRVSDIAADRVAANRTNRMFSLTDYMAGLGTAGPYFAANPENAATAAMIGLGAAGINRMARKIGPGGLATGLEAISGPLKVIDPLTGLIRQRPGVVGIGTLKAGQAEAAIKRRKKALEE